MLEPRLRSRIKQRYVLARLRIDTFCLIAFVAITDGATEQEVPFIVRAAFAGRNNVFDLQPRQNKMLRTKTIATAVTSRFAHTASHFGRYMKLGHTSSAAASDRVGRQFE